MELELDPPPDDDGILAAVRLAAADAGLLAEPRAAAAPTAWHVAGVAREETDDAWPRYAAPRSRRGATRA